MKGELLSKTISNNKHHQLDQEDMCYALSPYTEPTLHIQPGDSVTAKTLDASCGRILSKEDLPSKSAHWPWTNPCVGPIFVEGAEPGDTLVVDILEIKPLLDWAASWIRTNLGSLQGSVLTPMISPPLEEEVWIYPIDEEKVIFEANHSDFRLEMPYRPSLGTIGVAPLFEAIHTITCSKHGGNMDCVETAPGVKIYFNVNVKGGLLSFGDAHGIQGDGEISGTSVEMRSITTVRVDVLKNYPIVWPRIESDRFIMTVGCARPLEDAYRIAHKEMILWLVNDYGLALPDAYKMVENLGESRIGNVVNPNYSVVAKFPKEFLPPLAD